MIDQAVAVYTGGTFDHESLAAPLKEQDIKVRKGPGGMQLKYIKGSHAIETANRIFGFGRWGYKVIARGHQIIDDPKRGKVDMYMADVELSVVGNPFTFAGGGVGIVTEPFTVEMHEKAYKEAETDGMKRALRNYGSQFGLSLYDEDNYIEGVNGEVKQVKDVHQNGKQQAQPPAKKTVDSAPTIDQLKALCDEVLGPNKWGALRGRVLNSEEIGDVPDDMLSIAQKAQIHGALVAHQRAKANKTAASVSGK